MSRRKEAGFQPPIVEKQQVTEAAPGIRNRFTVLADSQPSVTEVSVRYTLQEEYDSYYKMYRQHPTARAAVEKRAKVMVANGWRLVPVDGRTPIPDERVKTFREFARRSHLNQLLRLASKDLDIFGEGFWVVIVTRGGEPIKALRLNPKYMVPKVEGARITKWEYRVGGATAKPTPYPAENVLHFKVDDPDNDVRGVSPFASLGTTIATDLFAMEYNGRFFENSAQTGTIFLLKDADDGEIERNKQWLQQEYVGARNAHKPIVLEGEVEVKKSVATNMDMQFLEGRRFNREEILAVLDIPPEKLGINEDSNRSVSKEADNNFRYDSVSPAQMLFEEPINDQLIGELFGWDDVEFRLNDTSTRSQLDMMAFYGEGIRLGVYSPNEVAGEFGLFPAEGGDERFVQTAGGLIPLSMMREAAEAMFENGSDNAAAPNANTEVDPATGMPVGDGDEE